MKFKWLSNRLMNIPAILLFFPLGPEYELLPVFINFSHTKALGSGTTMLRGLLNPQQAVVLPLTKAYMVGIGAIWIIFRLLNRV